MKVAVVDHGLCNLDSIVHALEYCGAEPVRIAAASGLEHVSHIVLPGVGAFPAAMERLRDRGLVDTLNEAVLDRGVPVLGICLGMQLMFTRGEEISPTTGLGWIEGRVTRLEPTDTDRRIPHVGWNTADFEPASKVFSGVAPGRDFYFVHSYHVIPDDPAVIEARTPYCGGFVSAVRSGTRWGVQFHPEKSQEAGFAVLQAFLAERGSSC